MSSPKKPSESKIVLVDDLGEKIARTFPYLSGDIHLEDAAYLSVELNELVSASNKAWKPWKEEKWDCDDQSVSSLHELRNRNYKDTRISHSPAAGRISGKVGANPRHSVLWCLNSRWELKFWDQTTGEEVPLNQLKPWRCYDK